MLSCLARERAPWPKRVATRSNMHRCANSSLRQQGCPQSWAACTSAIGWRRQIRPGVTYGSTGARVAGWSGSRRLVCPPSTGARAPELLAGPVSLYGVCTDVGISLLAVYVTICCSVVTAGPSCHCAAGHRQHPEGTWRALRGLGYGQKRSFVTAYPSRGCFGVKPLARSRPTDRSIAAGPHVPVSFLTSLHSLTTLVKPPKCSLPQ